MHHFVLQFAFSLRVVLFSNSFYSRVKHNVWKSYKKLHFWTKIDINFSDFTNTILRENSNNFRFQFSRENFSNTMKRPQIVSFSVTSSSVKDAS